MNDIMPKGIIKNDNLRVGVAIPTNKSNIIWLKRCLDSIEKQILKPVCVAIYASGCDNNVEVPTFHYSFPVLVQTTTTFQNTSFNRNIAASMLKDIDIISFMDCTDEMVPERLKYIVDSFLESPCDFVVHNYAKMTNHNQTINLTTNYISYPYTIISTHQYTDVASKNGIILGSLIYGHVSVSSVLWKNEQFDTNAEDVKYVSRLSTKEYIGNYINTMLSVYHNYNVTMEQLYKLSIQCKNNNQHMDAYRYIMEAFLYTAPIDQYILYYELSIIAYYIQRPDLGIYASDKVINNPNAPKQAIDTVKNNLIFYK